MAWEAIGYIIYLPGLVYYSLLSIRYWYHLPTTDHLALYPQSPRDLTCNRRCR